ncbi:MAG: HNH endonuclease [Armatimonadetes bacterium]|nr:HNH endonuclease [Armatimonadota bacterium]
MRPLQRGNPVPLNRYQDARNPLIENFGRYCAYCEVFLTTPEVEHKQPKLPEGSPHLATDWNNLLLACKSCNGIKRYYPPMDAYFPDEHNTALAFVYERSLSPKPSPNLNEAQRIRAQRTIDLLGLDRTAKHPKHTATDDRYKLRGEAYSKALLALEGYPSIRPEIVIAMATSTGFFSIWMTVFQDNPELCVRLIRAFNGTAHDCFDAQGKPTESLVRPLP